MDSHNLQPPFLGKQEPIYPHLMQAVRVTSLTIPTSQQGSSGIASSSYFVYLGYVQQLDPTLLLPRDREPCLIVDLTRRGLSPDFYTARLASSYNGLPVYEVGGSPESNCTSRIISFVSKVCQVRGSIIYPTDPTPVTWANINSLLQSIFTALTATVETTRLDLCTGTTISTSCETFQSNCCAGSGSGEAGSGGSGSISTTCCVSGIPSQLTVVLTNEGGCSCLGGTYTITYRSSSGIWLYEENGKCGGAFGTTNFTITLQCFGGSWVVSVGCYIGTTITSWQWIFSPTCTFPLILTKSNGLTSGGTTTCCTGLSSLSGSVGI